MFRSLISRIILFNVLLLALGVGIFTLFHLYREQGHLIGTTRHHANMLLGTIEKSIFNSMRLGNTAEVQAYYAGKPDFFSFKTLAELPANLNWQNGSHLPEMGSPQAKKGGTEYRALQDFPRTLRTSGPDSNGGFRSFIWDDVAMRIGWRHQDEFDFIPGLASEWATGDGGKTVYVRLDPKAQYSDGVPVTADDFFFMFWFYQSPYITAK